MTIAVSIDILHAHKVAAASSVQSHLRTESILHTHFPCVFGFTTLLSFDFTTILWVPLYIKWQ